MEHFGFDPHEHLWDLQMADVVKPGHKALMEFYEVKNMEEVPLAAEFQYSNKFEV